MRDEARVEQLAERWRSALAAWAPPPGTPPARPRPLAVAEYARRRDLVMQPSQRPLFRRAAEALDPPGSVLDVGAGAGAASLPLADLTTALTAVDVDDRMLAEVGRRAREAGTPVTTVQGRWPEVSPDVGDVDVVVCAHVLYNVADVASFVDALSARARRRVVYAFTEVHPQSWVAAVRERLLGVARPTGPDARDAVALLEALDLGVRAERASQPPMPVDLDSLVADVSDRLQLGPERADEVRAALVAGGVDPDRPLHPLSRVDEVVCWWPGNAPVR
jgi:SAM-dependent methyltransferase